MTSLHDLSIPNGSLGYSTYAGVMMKNQGCLNKLLEKQILKLVTGV